MTEQNPAPAQSPAPEESVQHSSKLALAGVVVLIALGAFFGGMAVTNFWSSVGQEEGYKVIESEVEEEEEIIEEEEEDNDEEEVEDVRLVSTESELAVNWIDAIEQPSVDVNQTLKDAYCPTQYDSKGDVSSHQPCGWPADVNQFRLGTVVGGEYDGRYLEMFTVRTEGLGYFHIMLYLLVDPEGMESVVVLDQEGRSTSESFPSRSIGSAISLVDWSWNGTADEVFAGMTIEETATIPELQPEAELLDVDGNVYLFTGAWLHYISEKAVSPLVSNQKIELSDGGMLTLYEAPDGASTTVGKNQLYVLGKDGRFHWYDLEVPFVEYMEGSDGSISVTQGVPAITWNDGTINEATYFKGALGGCGFTNGSNVVSDEMVSTLGFEVVGFADGYDIYEPATYDQEYYAELFNVISYSDSSDDPKTYEDFNHPYVYYQDALDRWVQMQLDGIIPPVECGKPVIYLYPEEEMELSVWVDPQGGFSYTEPVYDGGWEVLASPNGELVNLKDGKKYHYLFWEGRGDLYPQVETYWVIAQEDVEAFLITQLLKMNLNKMEIVDFLTFWLPRMEDDAYYKIGFHGTEIMNELAPLSLSVDPDHVFRILMDYEGLDAWEESNPPSRLPQANRDGFEVIEWGGVLR